MLDHNTVSSLMMILIGKNFKLNDRIWGEVNRRPISEKSRKCTFPPKIQMKKKLLLWTQLELIETGDC